MLAFLPFLLAFALASDVVVLTEDNFDEVITKNEFVLVKFYAPWCGHCKSLAPEYELAATQLKESGSSVVLAKVDTTVEETLGNTYGIRSYPTLRFFSGGLASGSYDGGRSAEEIVAWLKKKSGPPSKHLSSQAEIDEFVASKGSRGLAFISEDKIPTWETFAKSERAESFTLGHVIDNGLFGDRSEGTVELHKDGESPIHYKDNFETSDLTQWFLAEGFPLVDELGQESWTRAQANKQDLLAVFRTPETAKNIDSAVLAVAKSFKGQVVATVSDLFEISAKWGTSGTFFPTAVYFHQTDKPHFTVWDEESGLEVNEENLKSFVEGCQAGTYVSWRKSEPIPENNDGPVKTVVGKNFDEIVRQKKDVFIELYAPWCGHCKKLLPIFEELGEFFSNDDGVVIAKMDATANGLPDDVSVEGYPTLILFNANNEQVPYKGARDLDSFTTWLQLNRVTTPPQHEKDDL